MTAGTPLDATSLTAASSRWRRSGRRAFAGALALAVLVLALTLSLPGGLLNSVVAASGMVITAALCANGAYSLGDARALVSVRPQPALPVDELDQP